MNNANLTVIAEDAGKLFDKFENHFMIKILNKLDTENKYIKKMATDDKPTVNIILKRKTQAFLHLDLEQGFQFHHSYSIYYWKYY